MTRPVDLVGPADRITTCPSCERDVRVTDDELRVGRSFCASCDHRFAIVERVVGDAPYRSLMTVVTDGGGAPDARVIVREGGAIDLFAPRGHGRRSLTSSIVHALFVISFAWAFGLPVWSVFVCSVFLGALGWWGGTRLRIERQGETLVLRSGPLGLRRQRVPIGEITDVSVLSSSSAMMVRLALRDGESVDFRVGWPVGPATVAWLKGHLTELMARPAQAQLTTPP